MEESVLGQHRSAKLVPNPYLGFEHFSVLLTQYSQTTPRGGHGAYCDPRITDVLTEVQRS